MSGLSFRELIRSEGFDGMEISLLCLAKMWDTVIGAICSNIFWLSRKTIKFNDIGIVIGIKEDGNVYSTGQYNCFLEGGTDLLLEFNSKFAFPLYVFLWSCCPYFCLFSNMSIVCRSGKMVDLHKNLWMQIKPPRYCNVRTNRLSLNKNKKDFKVSDYDYLCACHLNFEPYRLLTYAYLNECIHVSVSCSYFLGSSDSLTKSNYKMFNLNPDVKGLSPVADVDKGAVVFSESSQASESKIINGKGCGTTFETVSHSNSSILSDVENSTISVADNETYSAQGGNKQTSTTSVGVDEFGNDVCKIGTDTIGQTSPLVSHSSPEAAKSEDELSEVNTQADIFGDDNDDDTTNQADTVLNADGSVLPVNDQSKNVMESDQQEQETGDFQCSRCFRNFVDYIKYTNHIHECQGPTRRYHCIQPGCTKEYSQRSIMLEHHKSVHLYKPFICGKDNCQHKYASQKALI